MAEVSCGVRSGAHKLTALKTLWTHRVSAADRDSSRRKHEQTTKTASEVMCECALNNNNSAAGLNTSLRIDHYSQGLLILDSRGRQLSPVYHLSSDQLSAELFKSRCVLNDSFHRMACWINKDMLKTPFNKTDRPHRGYCTVLFLPGKLCISAGLMKSRAYSWNKQAEKSPPLYKNRTAYYDILRVSPNATQAQIKTAYYKQSFIYHPDKNAGSEEAAQRFSQISEAYRVLGSIGLRKKYDRGILSKSDVQNAGRPSSREPAASHASSPHHEQQKRSRRSNTYTKDGKPIFDFDAFYQAHYGEQLQREREMRQRREQFQQQQQQDFRKWKLGKMTEMTVTFLLLFGGAIFVSLRS